MKQLLEVILNDDNTLAIKCCDEKTIGKRLNLKDPKHFDSFLKNATSALIQKIWGEKNTSLSKIIRLLSIAEISACAEPYSQAEEFWSMMMLDYIPRTEKHYTSLKKQYGSYRGVKQRPISFGDTSMFRMGAFPTKLN